MTNTGKMATIVKGRATFLGDNKISVNNTEYSGKHLLIAVGGRPKGPAGLPGIEHTIDSDGFFDIETQPKKAALVGAGYIGIELAGVLQSLGTDTHLFIRGETVLRTFDPMVQDLVTGGAEKIGIDIHRKTKLLGIEIENGLKTVVCEIDGKPQRIEGFDVVIMAVGREPNTDNLNLDKITGLEQRPDKRIIVDKYQNTGAPNVYSIGDACSHGVDLTPVAIAAGRRLADRLFGGAADAHLSYEEIPSVVFSHPPVGTVGLTEAQAKQSYGEDQVFVFKSQFTNMMYATMEPEHRPQTGMKLICAGPKHVVVGIHIVGLSADEMIQGFGVAVKMGATKADFDNCVAIHPTASEELVTMPKWGYIGGDIVMGPEKRSKV